MNKKSAHKLSFFLFQYFAVFTLSFTVLTFSPLKSYNPFLIHCANTNNCKENFNLEINNNSLATFRGKKIAPPTIDLNQEENQKVKGETTSSEKKKILVNLTTQILYAYEGDKLYFQTPISSGTWDRTPTGEFTIWHKVRSTRMTGGSGSDFYDLPNVPWVMFFHNNQVAAGLGYSFHGAYWHNNFGNVMSHGCINMRNIDAQKLYEWAGEAETADNPGTKVIIYKDK